MGDRVLVAFLAAQVAGVIESVSDDRRRLEVACEDGTRLTFELSRATGRFVAEGRQAGARLFFEDSREEGEAR